MNTARIVVVGGGHAGFHTVLSLRSAGWSGAITLVEAHDELPYQRPPLSKEFLAGKQELTDARFRPASFYTEHNIDLVTGAKVVSLDTSARTIELDTGRVLGYEELVLATGSRPRRIPVPGAELDGVFGLATGRDATILRQRISTANHVAVLGGGFIGLETAAMAASVGREVTVFEAADRLMARAISEPMSRYFEQLHRAHGVGIHLSCSVAAIQGGNGRVSAVVADDGTRHETELVVVGVGAVPADSLATEAGLATDNGVLVDEQLSTSAPHVSAIGDCARFSTRFADGAPSVRLESVQNATDQARYVAARLVAGAPGPGYDAVPWFWTEQFGRKLQIAGLTHGFDRVERTATDQDRFSIYCYRGETLLGCESVNSPREHLRARRRLAETTRAAAEA